MRKGLIAIIVIIIAVVGYVAGVVTTKQATYDAVAVMVEELERNTQFDVEVDWQEQGSRTDIVVVKVAMADIPDMPEFDFPLYYEETIELSYGFLNTKWAGSGDIISGDDTMSEVLYSGHKITSSGVVSRGGLRVSYDFPTLNMVEDDFAITAEPMQMHIVMAGEERRFNFAAPLVELGGEGNEGVRLNEIMVNADTRMLEGEVFSSATQMSLGKMELNAEAVGAPIIVEGLTSTFNALRADEELRMNGLFVLESLDAGPTVKGNARIDWAVEGLNYQEVMNLNEALQNEQLTQEETLNRIFATLIANDNMVFRLNELLVVGEGWGNLRTHGTVAMDFSGVEDTQASALLESSELFQHFDINFMIEEMPGMLQMMMMAFTTEALPWNLQYSDGEIYLNDELLDLNELQ